MPSPEHSYSSPEDPFSSPSLGALFFAILFLPLRFQPVKIILEYSNSLQTVTNPTASITQAWHAPPSLSVPRRLPHDPLLSS